jgi:hypothetical protein
MAQSPAEQSEHASTVAAPEPPRTNFSYFGAGSERTTGDGRTRRESVQLVNSEAGAVGNGTATHSTESGSGASSVARGCTVSEVLASFEAPDKDPRNQCLAQSKCERLCGSRAPSGGRPLAPTIEVSRCANRGPGEKYRFRY